MRLVQGDKKVLVMKDHEGVRKVSWSSRSKGSKKSEKGAKRRIWDDVGAEERAEVRRVLEGIEGSGELLDGIMNV